MDVLGAGADEHRADGVPLVRHRRGAAVTGLAHLGDLRLREQREVERDLRAEARGDGERGPSSASGSRRVCQGTHRLGQVELLRVRVQDVEPAVAERGERAPAPPSCAGSSRGRQAPPRVDDPDEPAGGLQPERRRHRLLEQRARRRRRSRGARPRASRTRALRRRARSSIERSSRCAPRARRPCRGCPGSSRRDARCVAIARATRARAARRDCRRLGPRARVRPRRDPRPAKTSSPSSGITPRRLRARERTLRLEHRREPRLVRDRVAQRRRHEDRREAAQCAKKTVCRSPCSRMSKRRPPSSDSATSVARSPAASEAESRRRLGSSGK